MNQHTDRRVAALFVESGGVYFGLPDVDPWDETRDARLYAGPWPVVAHPPCAAWCRWAWLRERDGYGKRGEDDGCFAAALAAVLDYGGVLEHPAHTAAWPTYGLATPAGPYWRRTLHGDGWVIEIDQAHYGHPANKPTWLFYVGPDPAPLAVTAPPGRRPAKNLHSGHRHLTPEPFRDVLLSLARSAVVEAAA